ncbi:hypothetical protein [Pasteurella multocida]|uniref:hypothetical protein n=1 Tax=Pasteurella multocida TaxID=747 RepID=UPI002301A277|nr:hypothetical protein [Pasteurella multocida]MDA5610585.1 hypothetical protein [Pasteurella multocida]MDA5613303.1 hypothetical protein [Pasteurella multocida]
MKNKPTLPQRMWYSLEQAAEKLTRETNEPVTIGDLIHYWLTDRLNISISFCINSVSDEYKIGNLEFNNDFFSKISILTIQGDYFKETEEDIYLFNKKLTYVNRSEEEIIIEGFLNTRAKEKLSSQLETEILKNKGIYFNDLTGFYLTPTTENKEERITIVVDYFFKYLEGWETINLNELIILHSDLELFKNHIYNNINLDILKKQTSPQTQNTQARFIRDLLKIHYGLQTASDVRAALDDSNSELRKDIETLETTAPSGKTIYKYLNQIED